MEDQAVLPSKDKENANKIGSPSMATSKYVREFESLFVPIRTEMLRNKAQTGQLRHCQFRSLCWRYFLNCLPEHYNQWVPTCELKRRNYEATKKRNLATLGIEALDDTKASNSVESQVADTTSRTSPNSTQHIQSVGDKQSQDVGETKLPDAKTKSCRDRENVYRTIERDVVRTFPDMEFFRQTEMQDILCNILFNFASENQHLSYKQGMHELLATLLYVAYTDSQNCLINYEGDLANETIASLLSNRYLEHDVYHLFTSLMRSIESWYQNDEILVVHESTNVKNQLKSNNELQGRSDSSSASTSNRSPSTLRHRSDNSRYQVNSVLGMKLKKISENIVKSYDPELFNHLEALQIAPQIYGIRWMRLLFGREFEFLDLLMVWDAIICDQDPMSMIDYVFASMLITIREDLVNGDYTHCLNNLMRHQFKNVPYVIKLALYLRDPVNHSRPAEHGQYQRAYNTVTERLPARDNRASDRQNTLGEIILSAKNYMIKEYEMREMQSTPATSMPKTIKPSETQKNKFPISRIGTSSSRDTFSVSSGSFDDLHSIVDYCWRLLSEQIDSLQRCLPKEKSLHSEDEIFVALAQLKKVRDVLKGSLKLEDELESAAYIIGENKT